MSHDVCSNADPVSCGGRKDINVEFANDITTQLGGIASHFAAQNYSAAKEVPQFRR